MAHAIKAAEAKTVSGAPVAEKGQANWPVLFLLSLGVLIAYVDRTSISSALDEVSFIRHFALTDVDRGWVNSAFFWSYGLVQVPMGWVGDRYGVMLPYTICFALRSAQSRVG